MRIKFKIALLFAALVTVILSIVGISVYFFSSKAQERSFETRLRNRAISTAGIYSRLHDRNLSVLQNLDTSAVASLYNKSISILGIEDKVVYAFSDLPKDSIVLTENEIERSKIEKEYFFNYHDKQAIAWHHADANSNFIVAVAADDIDGKEHLDQLRSIVFTSLIAGIIISFFTGLMFARNLTFPIKRITSEVNLISSNNLSQRIQVNEAKDELNQLAITFNDLLDRLQDSFSIQRRFISNASHELSTPLTSISSQLEVALQKQRTANEYEEVLASLHEDIKALQQLTRTLLDIAKAGTQGSIDLTEVRMDEVLIKIASDVQKLDKTYKTRLQFGNFPEDEQALSVFGNADLLYIALKNIVENGCKYSNDQQAQINTSFLPQMVVIKVASTGDIIAESDIENIFQPFFRSSSAQSRSGFGLGLTLARRILSLHKGKIEVESSIDFGTIFTITLPTIAGSLKSF